MEPWISRPLEVTDGPHVPDCWIVEGNGGWIASQVNNESNARLIAAAPELIDACKRLLAMIETRGLRGETREPGLEFTMRKDISNVLDEARNAIVKAEGRDDA